MIVGIVSIYFFQLKDIGKKLSRKCFPSNYPSKMPCVKYVKYAFESEFCSEAGFVSNLFPICFKYMQTQDNLRIISQEHGIISREPRAAVVLTAHTTRGRMGNACLWLDQRAGWLRNCPNNIRFDINFFCFCGSDLNVFLIKKCEVCSQKSFHTVNYI